MQYLLYGNGDFTNRGCEAIARGMCHILHQNEKANILLGSYFPERDQEKALQMGASCVKINRNREGVANIIGGSALRLGMTDFGLRFPYSGLKAVAKDSKFAIAIGGDNYCYSGRERYYRMNRTLKDAGKHTIFAACSIEERDVDERMLDDLSSFDAILPRETYTFNMLKKKGLENVIQCSDPAFVMPAEPTEFSALMDKQDYIGINISPLTLSYSDESSKSWDCILHLIQWLLLNTRDILLLIPHVYGVGNDLFVCERIKQAFLKEDRLKVLEGEYSAPQLKGIISSCRALICSRTHASIAGYSSNIPTYVLGYSCKSAGIAMDLFGKTEGFVFPVQKLPNEEKELKRQIGSFISNLDQIKLHLEGVTPQYIEKCYIIRDIIERL